MSLKRSAHLLDLTNYIGLLQKLYDAGIPADVAFQIFAIDRADIHHTHTDWIVELYHTELQAFNGLSEAYGEYMRSIRVLAENGVFNL